MKTLIMALLLIMTVSIGYGQDFEVSETTFSKSVAKADWLEISTSAVTKETLSIDKNAITKVDHVVTFYIKTSRRGSVVYYYYGGNCVADLLSVIYMYTVKANGKLQNLTVEHSVDYVAPDTVGSTMLDYACSNPTKTGK